MSIKLCLLFSIILLASTNGYQVEGDVLQLTDDDFPQVLKDYSYLLVEFYAPWCTHCKTLAPIYIEIAATLKQSKSEIHLATLDADQYKRVSTEYGVHGFPSLIFFVNGKRVDYSGDRTKDAIIQWVNKKILPPTTILKTNQQYAALTQNKEVSAVLFSTDSSQLEFFQDLARVDQNNKYYIATGDLQKLQTSETVKLVRNFDDIATFTGDFSTLSKWIAKNDRPIFLPFDQRTIQTIFTSIKKGVIFINSNIEQNNALRQAIISQAKAQSNKQESQFLFTEINKQSEHIVRFGDFLKIPIDSSRVVVIDAENQKKMIQIGQITPESIISFLKSVAAGEATEYGITESVPELEQQLEQSKSKQANTQQNKDNNEQL